MDARMQMLTDAINAATAKGDAWQIRDLELPGDFWTDPDTGELYPPDTVADEVNVCMGTVPASTGELAFNPITGATLAPRPDPQPQPTKAAAPRPDPQIRFANAVKARDAARYDLRIKRFAWQAANEALQAARIAEQKNNPARITAEQIGQNFREQALAERAARAPQPARRMAFVDASRKDWSAGDPNAFARARQNYPNRGAYSRHMIGRDNLDPARGPVAAPKV